MEGGLRMITLTKRTMSAIAFAGALFAATPVVAPQPAHAVSPGWAAAIGVGAFALGATVARPGYGYGYGYGSGYPAAYGYGYGYGYPAYGYRYRYGYPAYG